MSWLIRNGTGRNNIRWNNLTFNFFSFSQYPLNSNESEPIYFWSYKGIYMYKLKSYLSDGYNLTYSRYNGGNTIARYTLYIALNGSGNQNAKNLASYINSNYSKIKIISSSSTFTMTMALCGYEFNSYTDNSYAITINVIDSEEDSYSSFLNNYAYTTIRLQFTK